MGENGESSKQSCFLRWMSLQEEDLAELLQALNLCTDGEDHNAELKKLLDKNIRHFEDYISRRASLARGNVSPYFSPPWCTSLEGSMLWAGGCRASIFFRLLYALSGQDITSRLDEYLSGSRSGGLGELSASQIYSINNLHLKTIRQEDQISTKLASLQEEIADQPIAIIAKELRAHDEASTEAEEALDALSTSLASMLEEADNLRLNTLKELTSILTPIQAVDFLATARKLHLCVHAWGRRRDQERERHSQENSGV